MVPLPMMYSLYRTSEIGCVIQRSEYFKTTFLNAQEVFSEF